ncbi:MAG: helix-hairpin-helix domain-containing protein [Bacteroidales bacterium]|nr:helix-hairpin-helix domain-containing protein [Bacteroidales bacterium]
MQSFKNQIKAFFSFNKSQERGAFVLIILIVIAATINYFLPRLYPSETYDYSAALAEIEEWQAKAIEIKTSIAGTKEEAYKKEANIVLKPPNSFNPNQFPKVKWLDMGMPESVVNTILNYEAKGGSFVNKEDLQKIYGLNDDLYNQLKDFVLIPKSTMDEKRDTVISKWVAQTALIEKLDINRADSLSLLKIPGIGPFYAGQIVKYRNRLGGYTGLEQLGELYKMDSIRLHAILPYLFFQDTTIQKIDINTVEFKDLLRHPYFDYETTKSIFQERNKLGKFSGVYQLLRGGILSDSLYTKVNPYLKAD